MRGKLAGGLVAAAAFMAFTGTAQAGYAWIEYHQDNEDTLGVATYTSLPGERADVRVQVSTDGATVTIEDLGSPVRASVPPAAQGDITAPCEPVSRHKARCVHFPSTNAFHEVLVDTTLASGSRVRDLPAPQHTFIGVQSGPLADTIDLNYGAAHFVYDLGGANTITLGPHAGGAWRNGIDVGPGKSTIDVQNGGLDWVQCLAATPGTSLGPPEPPDPDLGPLNTLDTVFADAGDEVWDC